MYFLIKAEMTRNEKNFLEIVFLKYEQMKAFGIASIVLPTQLFQQTYQTLLRCDTLKIN